MSIDIADATTATVEAADPTETSETADTDTPVRRRADRGLLVVLAFVALWCAVMYLHVWRRHDRYGTFDNDLGFHDQFVWLIARGRYFSTVLGLSAFGHNATFGYFLLAPLSRIGLGGPHWLNFINTVAVGLGAVPLYLLARDRLGDRWRAVPFGLLWLLHPIVQGNVWETFHPDSIAMAPLLAAYLCATRRRWRPYALALAAAVIWKSDVTLAVVALGAIVAWRGQRKVGLATIAMGVAWFAFTIGWMIPHLAGGGTVFGPLYGDLGDTPLEVAGTAVTDPGAVADRVANNEPLRYSRELLAPYGFLPAIGGAPLLLGVPQAAVNMLSEQAFTREWRDNAHYQALPMVALAIALVEAVAFLDRRRGPTWAGRATGLALACSFAATVAWGSLPPFTTQFAHYWAADGDPARPAKDAAVNLIPKDAPVSANYLLVPHLTHREIVYSFPNPWRSSYYGIKGTKPPDPTDVHWLAADLNVLIEGPDRELWDCIIDSGAFITQFENNGIVVAQRRKGRDDDLACR
ncbi:MAG: DUF2079 domain-containing protein [Microthrixaceae bacterium]|nr:DUF2079 domain-containing protein [Microthrixaceae bacterium]